jgi:hypothetical protein
MNKIFTITTIGLLTNCLFAQSSIQTLTSSGNFTIPSNVTSIIVEVIGGGGNGGGNGTGGGGGGGYSRGTFAVVPNSTFAVTIGGISGTTSFGSLIQATGGGQGVYVNNPTIGGGGAGGVGSGGTFNYAGGTGGGGYYTYFGGGGGGAAGSNGNGGNGGNTIAWSGICLTPGGTAGVSGGVPGGTGGKGAGFTDANCTISNPAASGVNYGGGGGGGNGIGSMYGFGAPGVCKIVLIDASTAPLTAAAGNQTNVLCFGGTTGSATVTVSGGISPYTYAWTGGGTTATKSNLLPGNYTVTVTDAIQTSTTHLFTITGPSAPLTVSGTQDSVLCFGGNTGGINALSAGGTAPYQYSLDNLIFSTNSNFTGLVAGAYVVTIKDANNCLTSMNVVISEPSSLILTGAGTTVTTENNGTITLTANGGVTPYQFSVDGVNHVSNYFFDTLIGGTYSCEVIDGNGCISSTTIMLDDVTGLAEESNPSESNIVVFPNPTEDWITISRENVALTAEENYQVIDGIGRLILSGKINGEKSNVSLKSLKSGSYILKVGQTAKPIRIEKE